MMLRRAYGLWPLLFAPCLMLLALLLSASKTETASATSQAAVAAIPELELATYWVNNGAIYYYRLYGRWPSSWRDVVAEKLFQVELHAPDGHVIDPDDRVSKRIGDVIYVPPTADNEKAYTASLTADGSGEWSYMEIPEQHTFADMFAFMVAQGYYSETYHADEYFNTLLADDKRIKQLALLGMLESAVTLYQIALGDYPQTFTELINSRLSPFDTTSINPNTGRAFTGAGEPWDFRYMYFPAKDGTPTSFYLSHVDPDGTSPQFGVSY